MTSISRDEVEHADDADALWRELCLVFGARRRHETVWRALADLSDEEKLKINDDAHAIILRFHSSLLARLSEVEKALEPFAAFIDGNAAKALPDDCPLTNGSPMAKRQVTVGDFRRARSALTSKGE